MTHQLQRPAPGSAPAGGRDGARARRRPGALAWIGRLLVTAGILIGLYGVYELFITDVIAEGERTEIAEQWRRGQEPVSERIGTEHREGFPVLAATGPGDTLGLLHVPRWGEDYEVPIGSGAGDDVLDTGQVGHYTQTQRIGEVGNAGLSGHRTTHGKPLREVHHLQDGDALVVESGDAWLVYRVMARDIVKPHQSEVLDPVPPFEGARADGRYLTLTTCDPIYGITDRYIVWAEADYWTPKSEGLPPALVP